MTEEVKQDELASLKARADLLGLTYHPSIGVEKLREKVAAAIAGTPPVTDTPNEFETPLTKGLAPAQPRAETEVEKRLRLKQEATKLIRIRLTCMNPAKKEWDGEIFTAGNSVIGSVKKFVPFNADDGWHVPYIILQMIQDRMCQIFVAATDSRGNKVRKGKMIREFAVEILDPLTKDELAELAARQAATKAID